MTMELVVHLRYGELKRSKDANTEGASLSSSLSNPPFSGLQHNSQFSINGLVVKHSIHFQNAVRL